MGRLRKKPAGKARAGTDLKSVPILRCRGHVPEAQRDRNVSPEYAAMTKDKAQRSIRPFYVTVIHG